MLSQVKVADWDWKLALEIKEAFIKRAWIWSAGVPPGYFLMSKSFGSAM